MFRKKRYETYVDILKWIKSTKQKLIKLNEKITSRRKIEMNEQEKYTNKTTSPVLCW